MLPLVPAGPLIVVGAITKEGAAPIIVENSSQRPGRRRNEQGGLNGAWVCDPQQLHRTRSV